MEIFRDLFLLFVISFFQVIVWFMNYPEDWPWLHKKVFYKYVDDEKFMFMTLGASFAFVSFLTLYLQMFTCNQSMPFPYILYALNIIMQTILVNRMYVRKYLQNSKIHNIKKFDDTTFGKFSKLGMFIVFLLNLLINSVSVIKLMFHT